MSGNTTTDKAITIRNLVVDYGPRRILNGINLEITCRTAEYDSILLHEAEQKEPAMSAWTERTRDKKEQRLRPLPPGSIESTQTGEKRNG